MVTRINTLMTTEVTYGHVVAQAVKDLGTATPHVQVMKLISQMFGVALGDVKADCQSMWQKIRHADNIRGER